MAVDVVEGNSLELVGPQFKEVSYAEQKVCLKIVSGNLFGVYELYGRE